MQSAVSLVWRNSSATTRLVILDNVSGVLKPARLTLLLGPPASGKSTLLKALSGRLEHAGLQVTHSCVTSLPSMVAHTFHSPHHH